MIMKRRLTVSLNEDLAKKAKIKAITENTNLSAMIEELLSEYLNANLESKSDKMADVEVSKNDRFQ